MTESRTDNELLSNFSIMDTNPYNSKKGRPGLVQKSKGASNEKNLERDKIEISYYSTVNLNKDFNVFLSKLKSLSEEEKEVITRKINVYAILAENKAQLLSKLFQCKENIFYLNFYYKGKPKEILSKREKTDFNFFEVLHYSYKKFNKTRGIEEAYLDYSDMLYDMTGLPIVEWDLRNKIILNKIISDLKSMCLNDNIIMILVDEDEDKMQYTYQILNCFELKEKIKLQKWKIEEAKSNQTLYLTERNLEYFTNNLETVEIQNIFFKVRKLKRTDSLKTTYDFNSLLNSKEEGDKIRELYPEGDIYHSYVSIQELCEKKLFSRLLVLEFKKFELQLNGKFIKCIRERDKIIEYKTRWNYTFNVTSDNSDITIGIHQNTFNSSLQMCNHLYCGFIVLKSSYPMLFFVDHLPLKEARQNFINLKLDKGTYVVIPITSGYYFSHKYDKQIEIENIPIIEIKVDPKTKISQTEFSIEAKNVIDEIFEKFDINRDGLIGLQELKFFYEFAIKEKFVERNLPSPSEDDNLEYIKIIFMNFLDNNNEMNIKYFRKFFFYLEQNQIKSVHIFKKLGYDYYSNDNSRHFFLSFYSNEKIDVRISDGNNNRYTSYAYELYLRNIGNIVPIKDSSVINLICEQSRDCCNILLMLENKSDKPKIVTLDIGCSGYVSLNGFTYKSELKPKEFRYLFAIAIDKIYLKSNQDKEYRIKYEISCA